MTSLLQVVGIIIYGPPKSDQRAQRATTGKAFQHLDGYATKMAELEDKGYTDFEDLEEYNRDTIIASTSVEGNESK